MPFYKADPRWAVRVYQLWAQGAKQLIDNFDHKRSGRARGRKSRATSGSRLVIANWEGAAAPPTDTTLPLDVRAYRPRGRQKFTRFDLKRLCDDLNIVDSDVANAPLDAADVGTMQSGFEGQRLLRKALNLPQSSHVARQSGPECHHRSGR